MNPLRSLMRNIWYRVARDSPMAYADRVLQRTGAGGWILRSVPASTREKLYAKIFSTESIGPVPALGLILRNELVRQFYAMSEKDQRALNHALLWGGPAGKTWHEAMRQRYQDPERFRTEYLRYRASLVGFLEELLAREPGRYSVICEIGTGNGMFIAYLSRTLKGVARFVGCDINAEQIGRNKDVFRDSRVEFVTDLEPLLASVKGGIIFVTVGTLECFTRSDLEALLEHVRSKCDAVAIGLSEPVNTDLENETDSKPRGWTMFSHNYPHLLRTNGYTIARQEITPIDPTVRHYNNVTVLATTHARASA